MVKNLFEKRKCFRARTFRDQAGGPVKLDNKENLGFSMQNKNDQKELIFYQN